MLGASCSVLSAEVLWCWVPTCSGAECFALRESIANGDDTWEGEVVASVYRLNKLEKTDAPSDPLAKRPMGVAVGTPVQLGVSHVLVEIEDGGMAGALARLLFDNVHDAASGIGLDQTQQP